MNRLADSQTNSIEQILLKKTENSSAFLDAIETCYRMGGIGGDLQFSEIEAYWHNGSPLSDALLDELGRWIRCERPRTSLGWVEQGQLATNKRVLLEGLDSSEWFGVAEKYLYLLSPLHSPHQTSSKFYVIRLNEGTLQI
jgi:hypothetical protein